MGKKFEKRIVEVRDENGTQRKYVYYRDETGRLWSRLEFAEEIVKMIGMATIILGAFIDLICISIFLFGMLYMLATT